MPARRLQKSVLTVTQKDVFPAIHIDSLEDLRLRTQLISEKVRTVLATLEKQRAKMSRQRAKIENQREAQAAVWISSGR